jgi:hypothetical protein
LCKWLVRLIKEKGISIDTTERQLKIDQHHMRLNDDECAASLRINAFFYPYILPSTGNKDVDCHPLLNYPLATLCNSILLTTGNDKFARSTLPKKHPSTLPAIELTSQSLYNIFCLLKGRVGGIKIKDGNAAPLHHVGFDINTNTRTIQSAIDAFENPDIMFGSFFNLPFIERLCGKRKGKFDHRLVVTTFGVARIQLRLSETTTTPAPNPMSPAPTAETDSATTASTTKKRQKTPDDDQPAKQKRKKDSASDKTFKMLMHEANDTIDNLKTDLKTPTKQLQVVKKDIQDLQHKIDSMPQTNPNRTQLINDRQNLKNDRDYLVTQIIEFRNKINSIKMKKAAHYEEVFGTEPDGDRDQYSTSNPTSNSYIKTTLYIGCDPGLHTMVQSTYCDGKKAAFYLSQTNRFGALQNFVGPLDDQRIRNLLKLPTFPITSRDLDHKTNSHKHRLQLEMKKVKKKV